MHLRTCQLKSFQLLLTPGIKGGRWGGHKINYTAGLINSRLNSVSSAVNYGGSK